MINIKSKSEIRYLAIEHKKMDSIHLTNIRFTKTQKQVEITCNPKESNLYFKSENIKLKSISLSRIISVRQYGGDPKSVGRVILLVLTSVKDKNLENYYCKKSQDEVSSNNNYSCSKQKKFKSDDKSKLKELKFDFYEESTLKNFLFFLNSYGLTPNSSLSPTKLKFLIFICDHSGSGSSRLNYNYIFKPILLAFQNQVTFKDITTEYQGFCKDYLSKHYHDESIENNPNPDNENIISSWYQPNVIMTFSGDGIIHECVNGMYEIDKDKSDHVFYLPIPTGSGNSLCNSKNYEEVKPEINNDMTCKRNFKIKSPITKSCLRLINLLKEKVKMELYDENNPLSFKDNRCMLKSLSTPYTLALANKSSLSFVGISWALNGDIDKESEVLRSLGDARFDVYGLYRCLFPRKYQAKITTTDVNGDVFIYPNQSIINFNAFLITHMTKDYSLNINNQYLPERGMKCLILDGNVSIFQIISIMMDYGKKEHKEPTVILNNLKSIKLEIPEDVRNGHVMLDGEGLDCRSMEYETYEGKMMVL